MARRVITRDEMIETFAPARAVLQAAIDHARAKTTLERFAELHPELEREAGLKRLSGQGRWLLLADTLVGTIGTVEGFSVLSTDAQHNSGQYVFGCPGGALTVKQEPHDDSDPDDGRYIQEVLLEIQEQADLAEGVDPDEAILAYLSVTPTRAMLKIQHSTLSEVMKIPIDDLIPAATQAAPKTDRQRSRARSTRKAADRGQRPGADGTAPPQ